MARIEGGRSVQSMAAVNREAGLSNQMAAVNIWKRFIALILTLRSVPEFNCKSNMSFIKVEENSDFSFHNLPYGVFSTPDNVSTVLWLCMK